MSTHLSSNYLHRSKVFLVTANIASCFDHPESMIEPWLYEVIQVIHLKQPQFIAVHCQEVGGKNYEASLENVKKFVRKLRDCLQNFNYNRYEIFIDMDFVFPEKFTALGNLYFIHKDVEEIKIWDFIDKQFRNNIENNEHIGDIENVSIKEKSKFPQKFFPQCKWSRKGFLRTRWCLNGTVFDLVNIHLFHDASNLVAMEQFPSVYALNRKRAMEHTLDRFHNDQYENVPLFIFGDFNFRIDTGNVVKKLTENCEIAKREKSDETKQEFKKSGKTVLEMSTKYFQYYDHESVFLNDSSWLHVYDKELDAFSSRLQEYPMHFPPSYPFIENSTEIQVQEQLNQSEILLENIKESEISIEPEKQSENLEQSNAPLKNIKQFKTENENKNTGETIEEQLETENENKNTAETIEEQLKTENENKNTGETIEEQLELIDRQKLTEEKLPEILNTANDSHKTTEALTGALDENVDIKGISKGNKVHSQCYMRTRCPSWCDRILLSHNAKRLIDTSKAEVNYEMIGLNANMGDHKPISLNFEILNNTGTEDCCLFPNVCNNFIHSPTNDCFDNNNLWCYCEASQADLYSNIVYDSPEFSNVKYKSSKSDCAIACPCHNSKLEDMSLIKCVCSCSLSKSKSAQSGKKENKMSRKVFNKKRDGLKRVSSEPVKGENKKDAKLRDRKKHRDLTFCYSIDRPVRLRLRTASNRHISHHSSSEEDWYEEVPHSPQKQSPDLKNNVFQTACDEVDSDTCREAENSSNPTSISKSSQNFDIPNISKNFELSSSFSKTSENIDIPKNSDISSSNISKNADNFDISSNISKISEKSTPYIAKNTNIYNFKIESQSLNSAGSRSSIGDVSISFLKPQLTSFPDDSMNNLLVVDTVSRLTNDDSMNNFLLSDTASRLTADSDYNKDGRKIDSTASDYNKEGQEVDSTASDYNKGAREVDSIDGEIRSVSEISTSSLPVINRLQNRARENMCSVSCNTSHYQQSCDDSDEEKSARTKMSKLKSNFYCFSCVLM